MGNQLKGTAEGIATSGDIRESSGVDEEKEEEERIRNEVTKFIEAQLSEN